MDLGLSEEWRIRISHGLNSRSGRRAIMRASLSCGWRADCRSPRVKTPPYCMTFVPRSKRVRWMSRSQDWRTVGDGGDRRSGEGVRRARGAA